MKQFVIALLALVLAACATPPPAKEMTPVDTGKRIALTFDDVPRAAGAFQTPDERTRRIIAALREAGADQVAFFVNPGHIAERPGAERRIAAYTAAGHLIANHSNTHPGLSETPAELYLADIDAAGVWLEGRKGYRPWFRYPYLDEGRADKAKRDAVRAGLASRGLSDGYVTADASDWWLEQATIDAKDAGQPIDRAALRDLYVESHVGAADFFDDLARRAIGRSPVHVMLMHETDLAALFLPDLIAALRSDGWTIVSPDIAYADPIAAEAARYDTPSAQGTLTEMIAWEKGLPAPRWYDRNDTKVLSALFRARVLHLPPTQE
ncbi:polysaccharide deacetylase family protein [Erythrobacter sp. 3-20A1M]|uniref:polysaccharide deacetylase family protein n=1 Tax=Erythrobacter sp. 3-20A1M TaxID=2653850 RepID=UPI00203D16CE|nr:polysaccharide deacetylase family protein [Erythrobacter sp. 3-20A1M]